MLLMFPVCFFYVLVYYLSVHVTLQDGLYLSSTERHSSSGYVCYHYCLMLAVIISATQKQLSKAKTEVKCYLLFSINIWLFFM